MIELNKLQDPDNSKMSEYVDSRIKELSDIRPRPSHGETDYLLYTKVILL